MAADIKIERGVPMPNVGRSSKYPFHEMQVGDSFEVDIDNARAIPALNNASQQYAKKNGVKFARRGGRIWRVA